MKLKFLKHRWQRCLTRTLLGVIAAVLILGFVINLYWSPILARTVKKMVLNSTDSLYSINFTDAELHVLQGKIVLFNVSLQPDMKVYAKRQKLNLAPNNLYRLQVKRIVLKHIHPFTLYFGKRLDIGDVVLSGPQIAATYQLNHTKDTTVKDSRTLYQRIAKTLHSIHAGHIGLNDVQFKYTDYSGNKVATSQLKEMNLDATDLLIDSATQTDKSRFLYCRDITAELNNFSGRTLNGLYSYQMKLLTISTRTSQLNAQGIKLEPLAADEFFQESKHDRFTVAIDSMQLNHFDFLSYHKYRTLNATSMILRNGNVAVFSKQKPKSKIKLNKSGTFPNAGIYKLQTDLTIDTVLLNHINIAYSQLNLKSQKTGTALFNNTSGRILNLTTNAAALQKNNICPVTLTSYFMGTGKLNVAFYFNLADKNQAYSYRGHMGPMNLNRINPAVMPMAMIKINSGKVKSFDFDIHADVHGSRGRVSLLYNDLKITLLKPDTAQNKLKHMTIASLFANVFIIKHNNPDNEDEPARSFYVNYPRQPDLPFFKTIWKTLLSGIRSCAGYGDKKEKEIKTQMADRALQKKEHKEKKAERKEQRKEKKLAKERKKEKENKQ